MEKERARRELNKKNSPSPFTPVKQEQKAKRSVKDRSVISQYFDLSQGFSLFDEADPILCEGDLFRFKPGMENNFISRWVQISGRAFRYYRNQIQSFAGLSRPIVSIPKLAIESIRVLKINEEAFIKSGYLDEK